MTPQDQESKICIKKLSKVYFLETYILMVELKKYVEGQITILAFFHYYEDENRKKLKSRC